MLVVPIVRDILLLSLLLLMLDSNSPLDLVLLFCSFDLIRSSLKFEPRPLTLGLESGRTMSARRNSTESVEQRNCTEKANFFPESLFAWAESSVNLLGIHMLQKERAIITSPSRRSSRNDSRLIVRSFARKKVEPTSSTKRPCCTCCQVWEAFFCT